MLNYNRVTTRCAENSEGTVRPRASTQGRANLEEGPPSLGWHLDFFGKGMVATHWMAGLLRPDLGKQEIATLQGADKLRQTGMQGEWGDAMDVRPGARGVSFRRATGNSPQEAGVQACGLECHVCVRKHVAQSPG